MTTAAFKRPRELFGRNFGLTDRDKAIMNFIWRWKAAGTATIHEAIVRPGTPYSASKALERLARHGLIESVYSIHRRYFAWQLTEEGFSILRESLGELIEEGYLSENPWHDRNALAFHLGEWSTWNIPAVELYTEQEMRRRAADMHPDWVPSTKEHRADGYTRIKGDRRSWILAYEAELSLKSVGRYESAIRYYRMIRRVDRVFWMVGSPAIRDVIVRAKACINDEADNFHLFVDLDEYQRDGWNAKVVNERSQTLFTLGENMRALLGAKQGEYIGQRSLRSRVSVHYDPLKIIGKSTPSVRLAQTRNSD